MTSPQEQPQQQQHYQRRKFLVAVDGSSQAEDAVRHAISFIKHEADELILLHVVTAPVHTLTPEQYALAEHRGREILNKLELEVNSHNIPLTSIVKVVPDAREEICKQTALLHADYLVMGSRGLSMLSGLVLGSVSEYCAQHAHCPVIIVRPKEDIAENDF